MTQFFLAIPFRSATFAWRVVFGLKMSLMHHVMGHLPVGLCFPCHFCTVAHSSAGDGQSSSAPIIDTVSVHSFLKQIKYVELTCLLGGSVLSWSVVLVVLL
jgi:hypothetical protein